MKKKKSISWKIFKIVLMTHTLVRKLKILLLQKTVKHWHTICFIDWLPAFSVDGKRNKFLAKS